MGQAFDKGKTLKIIFQNMNHVVVPSVADQPEMRLREWRVIQRPTGYFYLIGFHLWSCRFRMTSEIAKLSFSEKRWTTASGRVYYTLTTPGTALTDTELRAIGVFHQIGIDLVDITEPIWRQMQRSESPSYLASNDSRET